MRITGGTWRGRTFLSPPDALTRPSTDMWRMSIFSALEARKSLEGAVVADLFAGSGSLGLESLSRGARHVTFVEKRSATVNVLQKSLTLFNANDRSLVIRGDVRTVLESPSTVLGGQSHYDVIFADPPYDARLANSLPPLCAHISKGGSLLIIEHGVTEVLLEHDGWTNVWTKEKGVTRVVILERIE